MEAFSIVIPTKNQGPFLERLLSYYCDRRLNAPILIADASDESQAVSIRNNVERASRHLSIEYKLYPPDIEFVEKLVDLMPLVRTEFAVLGADDDFFTLSGLRSTAEFLQTHPDFSIAHGHALIFEVEPGPVYGTNLRTASYTQRNVEIDGGTARIVDHLSRYSTTWYSMHRTGHLKRNIEKVSQSGVDFIFFTELLASCLSVIQGKMKKLDCLYMVRQSYPRKRYHLPTPFDGITGSAWPEYYRRFQDCLVRELADIDQVSPNDAIEAVKQGFWQYLNKTMSSGWQHRYGRQTASASLKQKLAARMPRLPHMWQRGKSLFGGEENQMLLPSLLRSSSPYHADFMPIYQAIGGGAVK